MSISYSFDVSTMTYTVSILQFGKKYEKIRLCTYQDISLVEKKNKIDNFYLACPIM